MTCSSRRSPASLVASALSIALARRSLSRRISRVERSRSPILVLIAATSCCSRAAVASSEMIVLQLAQDGPELADLIGQVLHALEALRLVFRLAELGRQHDEFGGLGFDAERRLDQRKTDPGQAVHHRIDLIEADEREQGRAHGQRGNEREGDQQVAGDALIPGPAGRRGREVAGCRHFGSSCWSDDALIPGIAIR